jgi:hypothetical protein
VAEEDVGGRVKPGHGVSMVVTKIPSTTGFRSPDSPARKRESRATAVPLALDPRFRGGDGMECFNQKAMILCEDLGSIPYSAACLTGAVLGAPAGRSNRSAGSRLK